MTAILSIDPGSAKSAWLRLVDGHPQEAAIVPNEELLLSLRRPVVQGFADVLVIEMVASYGMAVGAEVFETCVWIGRFMEAAAPLRVERLTRLAVKMHLCHDSRAKDANIRAALLDRFGPGKAAAVGTKQQPGPLYGIRQDLWSALALGVSYADGAR